MLNLESLVIDLTLGDNGYLDRLVSLRHLGLHSHVLSKDLQRLTNLVSLTVDCFGVKGEGCALPISLQRLTVNLYHNNEMCERHLAVLTNLTELSFDTAERLHGDCFLSLPRLRALSLDSIDGSFLISHNGIFSKLGGLTKLALWCPNNITDECLAPLLHLRTLIMLDNKAITSRGLNALPILTQVVLEPDSSVSQLKSSISVYHFGKDKICEQDRDGDGGSLYNLNRWYMAQ